MPSREELAKEFCELCREDGLQPDEAKINKTFERYSIEQIERLLEACYRFGAATVIKYT